jgi:hypothetical protein
MLQTLLPNNANPTQATTSRVALPLTYDEVDYNTLLTWSRLGAGPRITPSGLLGDGFTARLRATASLPSWLTSSTGALTIHATIQPLYEARDTTRDVVVYVGPNDATANPRLSLAIVDDGNDATLPNVAVRCYTGSVQQKNLARRNWRYRWRVPELSVSGNAARPQGVLHIGPNTVLITVHFNDISCRCYKIETSTGRVIDYFDFDSSNHHVASIAYRESDGTYWFADYATGDLLKVNLENSFATGTADVDLKFTLDSDTTLSAIDWVTISGTEYFIFVEYMTSGTPYLYVVDPTDIVNNGTFNVADRIKRMACTVRVQGATFKSGTGLYVASNNITGDAGTYGKVQLIDLATFIASGSDGASFTTYASTQWYAPSQYVEDLHFGPDGELWTMTEGRTSPGSDDGWLAMWSSPLTDVANHYTIEYDGAGTVKIKINNQLFENMSWTPSGTPAAVAIAGPPAATEGQQNGFFIGYVKNVVIQDTAMTLREYQSATIGNVYEPNSLTTFSITLTNPGGETGDTSGWTNETGSLAIRTTNPAPKSGGNYFTGGANVATKARQRVNLLTATGLTGGQVDAGNIWAVVDWWQTNFSAADLDTGTIGLRFLDTSQVQISENIGTKIDVTPDTIWIPRSYGIAIPSGTRYIDIVIDMTRNSGTNLDTYIDDIALKVYRG